MPEASRIQDSDGNDLNKTPAAHSFDKLLDDAEEKSKAAANAVNENLNEPEPEPKPTETPPEPEPKPEESRPDTVADTPPVENKDEPVSDTPPKTPSAEELIAEASNLSGIQPETPEPEPETPVISEELSAELTEIEQNPHTEAAVKNTITNLRSRLSEVSSEAKKVSSLQKQLEELQNQPAGTDLGITKEDFDSMQAELLMFKRRFQLESDPVFTKEFDDEIKADESRLEALLVKYGMAATDAEKQNPGDMSIEELKRKGGIVRTFEDAPGYFNNVKEIIAKVNGLDAEDFSGIIKNVRQLNAKKQFRLEEESGKADEHFKKISENNAELGKQQEKAQQGLVDYRTNLGTDLTKKFKFLQEMEVKGTDDQKAAATLHNERIPAHREKLDRIVNAQGLEDYADIAELAMMTSALTNSLSDALNQLKEEKAKNKKISESSRIKEVNKPPVTEKKAEFKATNNIDDALDFVEGKNKAAAR